jgi:hypothetical protein
VLVVRRLQVLAQLVGGQEQLRLEAEMRAVTVLAVGLRWFLTPPGHLVLAIFLLKRGQTDSVCQPSSFRTYINLRILSPIP